MLGRSGRATPLRLSFNYSGNGYHYEADEVRKCVQSGLIESTVMPLKDSISVVRALDAIKDCVYSIKVEAYR